MFYQPAGGTDDLSTCGGGDPWPKVLRTQRLGGADFPTAELWSYRVTDALSVFVAADYETRRKSQLRVDLKYRWSRKHTNLFTTD